MNFWLHILLLHRIFVIPSWVDSPTNSINIVAAPEAWPRSCCWSKVLCGMYWKSRKTALKMRWETNGKPLFITWFLPLETLWEASENSIACLCSILKAMVFQPARGTYYSSSVGAAIMMKRSTIRTTCVLNNVIFLFSLPSPYAGVVHGTQKNVLAWETYGKTMGNIREPQK